MEIGELKRLKTAIEARFYEIDREQFDEVRGRDTRTATEMWRQACAELVADPEWREPIRVMVQGWCYYGGEE